jgi:hypothetical protein
MKLSGGWMRDLHFYLGLFVCPAILVFAVSTLLLNHPQRPARDAASAGTPPKQVVGIEVPDKMGTLEQARAILRQLEITGEIDYIQHDAKAERLVIPVTKPGQRIQVEIDLRARTATVERQDQGLAAALIYLHKMPGPHNAKFRGNWVYTVWWALLADAVVYGILMLTGSGLYLWWRLKAERKLGWVLLGTGALTTVLLVFAICAG